MIVGNIDLRGLLQYIYEKFRFSLLENDSVTNNRTTFRFATCSFFFIYSTHIFRWRKSNNFQRILVTLGSGILNLVSNIRNCIVSKNPCCHQSIIWNVIKMHGSAPKIYYVFLIFSPNMLNWIWTPVLKMNFTIWTRFIAIHQECSPQLV